MTDQGKPIARQPFGPSQTDLDLCYFVCWDRSPEPEDGVAERWAHFTDNEDAVAYFKEKSKDETLFVWKGELGISKVDSQFDWFHTNWSKNLRSHLVEQETSGKGYRWSRDAFEEFDSLDIEEEES
ncbi:MAG: hypothetical protein ACREEJ_04985 [Ensifer adhaerens]|uniref:hypothetical protein n=1 Tax=Ensifer sp. 4252 TaxID=3373915 RepID=UPI003D1B30E9